MKRVNLKLRKLLLNNKFYYVVLTISLIYCFINLNTVKTSTYDVNDEVFEGMLESYSIDGNKLTFTIKNEEKLKCNYYLESLEELEYLKNNLKLGSNLKIEGELSKPLNNTIPNNFNYKKYLYYHDIFYTCEASKIDIESDNTNLLYDIKNKVISRINSFEKVSNYLLTFIIGDKSYLSEEAMDAYRDNGITHLFAISGMHIGLFSALLLFLLKKVKLKENKRYIIVIIFIWFYVFLTGFAPSVLRAGLLFTLLTLNKVFYTEVKTLNVLLLTGSILLFVKPEIITDIGFQYSFLTTFGLMYSGSVLKKHKVLGTSVVAMLFSLPITINNFYTFNLLSILINVIFVPFVSVVVYPLCLLTFIFKFLEPITHLVLTIMEYLNNLCSSISVFKVVIPKLSIFVIIIYYLVLFIFINKKYKICVLLLFAIIFLNKIKPYIDSNYYIEFLDVGQGDSILIRSPHSEEVIMIDTGGKMKYEVEEWKETKGYNISDNTITYLYSLGITKIDFLILTHGDADHLGEAMNIIEKINVKNVKLNEGEYNFGELEILDSGINIVEDYNGKLNLKILKTDVENDENSNSIIIYLDILNTKILLMGDAPKDKELEILEKYDLKDIDIIKLGHHGSKTSSSETFLNVVNPSIAIISSGRNNKFNHPNKETIDTLEKLNIEYYNTQTSGTLSFKISDSGVTFKEQKP